MAKCRFSILNDECEENQSRASDGKVDVKAPTRIESVVYSPGREEPNCDLPPGYSRGENSAQQRTRDTSNTEDSPKETQIHGSLLEW